ncbi:MAG: YfhO family protein, partial [Akkermansia sp.]
MKKSLLKTIFSFAAAPALAALTVLIAFYINGVYPFGENTFNTWDNGEQLVPFYSHLYDLLSGQGGSFFYSLEAGGLPITGVYHMVALLFPSTWIIFLTGKEMMGLNFSWIMVSIASMTALTSFIYFHVAHKKLDVFWQIIFSFLYATGGYIIVKQNFLNFLHFMMLFPLIALGFQQLCVFRKYILFFITIFISLLSWYYMTFPILFTSTIGIGLYSFLFLSKEERRKLISLYIIVVSSAVILSSCSWYPTIELTLHSVRNGIRTIPSISTCISFLKPPLSIQNIFNLYAGSICIVIIIRTMYSKIGKKNLLFFGGIMAFLLLPLIIYPSFLIFHGGSFVGFPFRYAFIPAFILLIGCAFAIEQGYINQNITLLSHKWKISLRSLGIILVISSTLGLILFYLHDNSEQKLQYYFSGISILGAFLILLPISFNKNTCSYIFISCLAILESVTLFACLVPSQRYKPISPRQQKLEFNHSQELIKQEIHPTYPQSRTKSIYASLPINFSLLTKIPSLDSYTHTTSKQHQDFLASLGYERQYTLTREEGGTIFTDALFAVTTIFTSDQLNPKFYEYSQT